MEAIDNNRDGSKKRDKLKTALMAVTVMAAACICLMLLYEVSKACILPERVHYRAWIEWVMLAVNLFLLPTSLLGAVLLSLRVLKRHHQRQGSSWVYVTIGIAAGMLYAIWFLAALLYLFLFSSNIEWERKAEDGFLSGTSSGFLDTDTFVSYYEDYTLFTKSEYWPTAWSVKYEMEKLYGMDMEVTEKSREEEGFGGLYQLYVKGEPELIFLAASDRYRNFFDDYVERRADRDLREAAKLICPDRVLSAYDKKGNIYTERMLDSTVLTCSGRQDVEAAAVQAAELIALVSEDAFYDEHRAVLTIYCEGTAEGVQAVPIPFGKTEVVKYPDWGVIYKRILDNYDLNGVIAGTEDGSGPNGVGEAEITEPAIDYEASPFYVEGAYKVLYESLFEQKGFPYETAYNAKGNFYAPLGEGTGSLTSTPGTLATRESIVYDRESKNEKCHLFVHYTDYYKQGESGIYATEIMDMYAVDMSTGEVYASGRHAWADVGSQEYCEATGEP